MFFVRVPRTADHESRRHQVAEALLRVIVRGGLAEASLATARVNNWFEKHTIGATGWILAIVGFLVARDAAFRLGFFG